MNRRRRRRTHTHQDEPFTEPNTPTAATKEASDAQLRQTLLVDGKARPASSGTGAGSTEKRDSQHGSSPRATSPDQGVRPKSSVPPSNDSSGLTGDDAISMAAAFRNALRKPSFTRQGDSDGSGGTTKADQSRGIIAAGSDTNSSPDTSRIKSDEVQDSPSRATWRESVLDPQTAEGRKLLDKELASEGTSIRSLEGRKKPSLHEAQGLE